MLRIVGLPLLLLIVMVALIHAHWRAGRAERETRAAATRVQELERELEKRRLTEEERRRRAFERVWSDVPEVSLHSNQPEQSGRILATDPGADRHTLSLGEKDSVEVGYQYIVHRGDLYVTTIEVTEVHATSSVARELTSLRKTPIVVGDEVMNGD